MDSRHFYYFLSGQPIKHTWQGHMTDLFLLCTFFVNEPHAMMRLWSTIIDTILFRSSFGLIVSIDIHSDLIAEAHDVIVCELNWYSLCYPFCTFQREYTTIIVKFISEIGPTPIIVKFISEIGPTPIIVKFIS
eukprot:905007_1